jgi:hypothetical protein
VKKVVREESCSRGKLFARKKAICEEEGYWLRRLFATKIQEGNL